MLVLSCRTHDLKWRDNDDGNKQGLCYQMAGGGASTTVTAVIADGDDDSVSSDSGRGPSEEEFRATSLHLQQQHHPHWRLHNGTFTSTVPCAVAIISLTGQRASQLQMSCQDTSRTKNETPLFWEIYIYFNKEVVLRCMYMVYLYLYVYLLYFASMAASY